MSADSTQPPRWPAIVSTWRTTPSISFTSRLTQASTINWRPLCCWNELDSPAPSEPASPGAPGGPPALSIVSAIAGTAWGCWGRAALAAAGTAVAAACIAGADCSCTRITSRSEAGAAGADAADSAESPQLNATAIKPAIRAIPGSIRRHLAIFIINGPRCVYWKYGLYPASDSASVDGSSRIHGVETLLIA